MCARQHARYISLFLAHFTHKETESLTQVTQPGSDGDGPTFSPMGPDSLPCFSSLHSSLHVGSRLPFLFNMMLPLYPPHSHVQLHPPSLPLFPFLLGPKHGQPSKPELLKSLLYLFVGKWHINQNVKGGKSQNLQPAKRAPSPSPKTD